MIDVMATPASSAFRFALGAILTLSGAGVFSADAGAQELAEGEAEITTRAEVRIGLESGPGTNSAQLSEIGTSVGGALRSVRSCYDDLVAVNPTIHGSLRFLLVVQPRRFGVELRRDEVENEELVRCVTRALRAVSMDGLTPTKSAYVRLDFTNNAVDGVERTRARREVEDRVDVHQNSEGEFEASGGTANGMIRFTIESPREERTAAVQRGLRAAIPGLLDCRRKSSHRGSPAGVTRATILVSNRGRARARMTGTTVNSPRAERCLRRTLQRQRFEESARGRALVRVEFFDRR